MTFLCSKFLLSDDTLSSTIIFPNSQSSFLTSSPIFNSLIGLTSLTFIR